MIERINEGLKVILESQYEDDRVLKVNIIFDNGVTKEGTNFVGYDKGNLSDSNVGELISYSKPNELDLVCFYTLENGVSGFWTMDVTNTTNIYTITFPNGEKLVYRIVEAYAKGYFEGGTSRETIYRYESETGGHLDLFQQYIGQAIRLEVESEYLYVRSSVDFQLLVGETESASSDVDVYGTAGDGRIIPKSGTVLQLDDFSSIDTYNETYYKNEPKTGSSFMGKLNPPYTIRVPYNVRLTIDGVSETDYVICYYQNTDFVIVGMDKTLGLNNKVGKTLDCTLEFIYERTEN